MIVSTFLNSNNRFGGNYDSENIPNNRTAVNEIYQGGLTNPIWQNNEWIEGLSQSELDQIQAVKVLEQETEMYRKRQCDGVLAYAQISAEFRLAKLSGAISEATHSAIERALIPVRNEVLSGQWISALNELELIGNAIGQELYDRLHLQISNYIAENY